VSGRKAPVLNARRQNSGRINVPLDVQDRLNSSGSEFDSEVESATSREQGNGS
jgi:hypothetical protein